MVMVSYCFKRLQQSLARFTGLSDMWPVMLTCRIVRCEGFLEQLTLFDESTADWLCSRTEALLSTLPADADDAALIRLLTDEFEDFHCHAVAHDGIQTVHWNSLKEPFALFFKRYPYADLFISTQTHAVSTEAVSWFQQVLGKP